MKTGRRKWRPALFLKVWFVNINVKGVRVPWPEKKICPSPDPFQCLMILVAALSSGANSEQYF
jgi:hypothetical protein